MASTPFSLEESHTYKKTEKDGLVHHQFVFNYPNKPVPTHILVVHPNLPHAYIGDVYVSGKKEHKNSVGPAEMRKTIQTVKTYLPSNIKYLSGLRTTGARGQSRVVQTVPLEESVEGLVIKKTDVHFDDDLIQHSYKIFHPNLKHPVYVHATKYFKNPELARMNVGGNDIGKLGPAVVRHVARYIADDMKVTQYSGHRTGGAGSGRLQKVTIKERVKDDNDEIYHTKDLEHFSQHLIDKHGAHVEMYWTPEGHVNLQTLIVPKELRNQGIASNVISDIKKYSNKNKVKIILNAVPLDNSTKSEQLIDFYKSHGFVENKGRNKDYRIAGNDTMYRNHKENKKKK